ncbi:FAD-binding protein [Paraburkholderia sp.]|jgi:flavin-dependent dehydrogenase|uniref:FAD-dependent oxidoreductase n=1 Tax=Paraburkholderia sp. TaxID=1926495 RepID=UPI0010636914|nr:FAD-binding protein [Paraburkholderia sp.]
MNSYADVVVIGDGPAACAAAITAARAGLDIVMLGRGRRSGGAPEYLSHASVTLLAALAPGLSHEADIWLDPEALPQSGRALMRDKFDQCFRIEAIETGTRYVSLAAGRVEPHIAQGRISGVRCGGLSIASPVVIDASGSNGWLRRAMRLEESIGSPALWLERGLAAASPHAPENHWEIAQQGWLWIKTTGAQKIWTSLSTQRETAVQWPDGMSPIGRRWRDCRRWRCLQQAAGPGYFVCGDAAMQLDPATGDGFRFAVESGARAASMAAQLRRHPESSSLIEALYSDWIMQFYVSRTAALAECYANAGLLWAG